MFVCFNTNYEITGNCISRFDYYTAILYFRYISGVTCNIVSQSTESEIGAPNKLTRVLVCVESILNCMGILIVDAIQIYVDNKALRCQ